MKILVGYDGSKAAENALKAARAQANAYKAEVILVTALEQGPNLHNLDIEKAESNLEYLITPFNIDKIPCETIVTANYLSHGEALVQLAIDNQIDEIVIGVRKRSQVGKLLLGSTAQYVILNAPCSVLSVK